MRSTNPAVKQIEDLIAKVCLDKGNDSLKCSNNTVRNILADAAKYLGELDPDLAEDPTAAPR